MRGKKKTCLVFNRFLTIQKSSSWEWRREAHAFKSGSLGLNHSLAKKPQAQHPYASSLSYLWICSPAMLGPSLTTQTPEQQDSRS